MERGFRLRLGAAPEEGKRLRKELHAWLLHAGISGATRHDIAVAAHEAFLNAVDHDVDTPDVTRRCRGRDHQPRRHRHGLETRPAAASARAKSRALQLLADPRLHEPRTGRHRSRTDRKSRFKKESKKGRNLGQPGAPTEESGVAAYPRPPSAGCTRAVTTHERSAEAGRSIA
jgi:hypothetical protein